MRVLIANNSGAEARRLAARFPDRIGHIYGPDGFRGPFAEFPYALDNGAWPAFTRSVAFDALAYRGLIARATAAAIVPMWPAVPDVVCDRDATIEAWYRWAPELRAYGYPLAFVVQNGMTHDDVPASADLVFVGGSTEWKWETVAYWCEHFPRVHVGRVNMERLLWQAHRAGAESCDGSGWFRGDRSQLDGLWYYLADSSEHQNDAAHGPMQPRLFAGVAVESRANSCKNDREIPGEMPVLVGQKDGI